MRRSALSCLTIVALLVMACDAPDSVGLTEPAARPTVATSNALGVNVNADAIGLTDMTAILSELDVPLLQPGPGERAVTTGTQIDIGIPILVAISAVRHVDGRFTGQWTESARFAQGTQRFHGDVVCFRIAGIQAIVGVRITQSNDPNYPPGLEGNISVTDGGEPGPDFTDTFQPTGNALADCAFGPPVLGAPVTRGQVQIH
jgi:hypothetical protein